MKDTRLQGLYGISDTKLTPTKTLIPQLHKAIQGGLRIFQYRDKDSKDSEIAGLVGELQAICDENNVLFVLNDRYELAIKLGVGGLHLGKDEVAQLLNIRESFQGVMGVSCYDSIELAQRYENAGVDYVAFGALFLSPTKKDAKPCALSVITEAKNTLKIPICGIGGICVSNVSLLKECDMIAVISSLWNIESNAACHTEPLGEVSNTESKKDFSPMAQNDNKQILDSTNFVPKAMHSPFKAENLKDSDYNYITSNAKNLIAAWQTKSI